MSSAERPSPIALRLSSFLADLRFAARTLSRSPGFTTVALLTLALGIGANTAVFSVVNGVLLKPIAAPEPDRLVAVFQTLPAQGITNNGVSYLNFADWAARATSFEALGAVRLHDYTLTGQGEPTLVIGGGVTAHVFSIFRPTPILGRTIGPDDDKPGAPPVAVLSEPLWRERFGADTNVLGKPVMLDNRPATIVGVLPAAFRTPPDNPPAQLWAPLAQDPVFGDLRQKRGGHYLRVVARLKPGVSLAAAEAELATVQSALVREYPKENEGWGVRLVPLAESLVSGVRTALFVLLGAVALVFLIACANVANLLLVRAGARSREIAVRTALGAGRGRLVRQLLTECLLLALTGGVLGVALAAAAMGALRRALPADLPRAGDIALDGRVLLFSLGASIAAAVVFGLAPALQGSRASLSDALREGTSGSGESASKRRLRGLLVVAETALSFVLLVGAGLLARSFLRLQQVELGFDASHVMTAGLSLPRAQYSKPEQWLGFYRELVDRLKAEPGVEAASASLPLPLYGGGLNFAFQIEGRPVESGAADASANYTSATPEYFRVLGVRRLSGRLFSESDVATSPKVCVVSATFAKRFFPGEDPIGRRLVFGFTAPVPREIVGVVGDVKRDGLGVTARPEMYVPWAQEPFWAGYLALRSSGDPAALSAAIRRDVQALDPTLPIAAVQPMTQIVYDSVAQPRFRTRLLGLFGATALVLALIGLYGVISYNVGRRTREVGIRMALGASRSAVLRLILLQGLGLTAVGLAAGLAGAFFLTRFLATLLFDVGRFDPGTYGLVLALLLAAGALACLIPAARATRVDPVDALRYE